MCGMPQYYNYFRMHTNLFSCFFSHFGQCPFLDCCRGVLCSLSLSRISFNKRTLLRFIFYFKLRYRRNKCNIQSCISFQPHSSISKYSHEIIKKREKIILFCVKQCMDERNEFMRSRKERNKKQNFGLSLI